MSIKKVNKKVMTGYKASFDYFDNYIDKHGQVFELGKEYIDPRCFEFHETIIDCLINYPLLSNLRILEIEASGTIKKSKKYICASTIKIKRVLKNIEVWKTLKGDGNLFNKGIDKSVYCNQSNGVSQSKNCGFVHGVSESSNLYLSKGFYRVNFAEWGEGVSCSNYVNTGLGVHDSEWVAYSSALYKTRTAKHSTAIYNSYFTDKSKAVMLSYYIIESSAVYNCMFVKSCQSITNCMFCYDIKNKEFYIFNKKYSKKEYFKHLNKIEKIIKENQNWHPFELYWEGDSIIYEETKLDFSLKKKAKEFPPELLKYIKKNFVKSAKEEKIFERIFDYKIGDCK